MQITKPNTSKVVIKNSSKHLAFPNNVKKEELVRLMLQTLNDLEYPAVANFLQEESGISLESDVVSHFRSSILSGNWVLAENLLVELPFTAEKVISKAQFLIRQQKFLELLEKSETLKALHVLRNEITPLGENTDRLHQLSSLLLCSSIDDIMNQAQWTGSQGGSRDQLLIELQGYIESSAMIPKHRLVSLINQAMEWQKCQCLYHCPIKNNEFSLFSDHICTSIVFPSHTKKVLKGHTDEVWHVAYSNDGNYLASISKDEMCIIWDMKSFKQIQLIENDAGGTYCAWSPDDSKLLICGIDNAARLWDPHNGLLEHKFESHKDQVTTCVWLPDNNHFITGSCDKVLYLWSVNNPNPISQCAVHRTTDMKITNDGKRLVTIGLDQFIMLYQVESLKIINVGKIKEDGVITSLSITKDGKFALVNIQQLQELHLWDLNTQKLVHRYTGQKQGKFIIRSTLGGIDESYVLSGSEDNRVYIWNREHETLLQVLEGHASSVSCVSWCPTENVQYVSCSDDHTIRVWGEKEE